MRLVYAGISLLSAVTVMADTEIVNFKLPLTTASLAPGCVDTWNATSSFSHRLGLDIHSLMLNMSSNESDKYILLGDLQRYSAWTARLSWPGSSPTKFEVEVHPHGDSMDEAILHISAKPLSPPHPHPYLPLITSFLPLIITSFLPLIITQLLFTPVTRTFPSTYPSSWLGGKFSTAVQVILEPLEYGVVPRTAVSTIYWIIGAIILGVLGTPYVIKYMEMQMACDDKGRFTYERREVRQGEAKGVENEQEAVHIDEVDKAIGDARQRIGKEQVS